jgi:Short C-terminal domain
LSKPLDQIYEGTPEQVFEALRRVVVALGFQIRGADARTNTLFFSGRHNMSGSAVSVTPHGTRLSLVGGKDGATIHARVAEELGASSPDGGAEPQTDVPQQAGEVAMAAPSPDEASAHPAEFQMLRGKVQQAVEENLAPGEAIRVIIRGAQGQAMIGTDTRVFVCEPGFMAGASFGAEVTSWSYLNLLGVQLHKGMVSGSVVLQGPGQTGKKTSYWGQGDDDPRRMPNAIPIAKDWKQVQAGVARLRQLIDQKHAPAPVAPLAAPTPLSVADELRKLADLRSHGILTDAEFQSQKARLLEQ